MDKIESFIITTDGRKVELQPVSQRFIQKVVAQVRKEFEARGEPLTPPGYWAIEPDEKGEGGEWIAWDKASVEKDGTEEEKKAFTAHEDAVTRLETAQQARSTEVMLLKGIKNEQDRKPSPEWVREQEEWGIELPQEPKELSLEYIQTEVLKTPSDLIGAISRITGLSADGAFDPEDLAAMESSFRRAMVEVGRQARGLAGPEVGTNGTGEAAQQIGRVDVHAELPEYEDRPLVELNA